MSDTQDIQTSQESSNTQDNAGAEGIAAESASSEPDQIAPPLAAMITSIRSAVVPNASSEMRAAGVTACRSILTVLEAKPGQPLVAAPQALAAAPSPLASLLSQSGLLPKLAAMSREQLLDLLKQLTGAAPARSQTPATAGPRFHLIQIPQMRRPGST